MVQLIILGATLSITATNAGAVALPCANPDTASEDVEIGFWSNLSGSINPGLEGRIYLTQGEMSQLDFLNECKNFTKFKIFFFG